MHIKHLLNRQSCSNKENPLPEGARWTVIARRWQLWRRPDSAAADSINGKQYTTYTRWPNSNYDNVCLIYGKVNIPNPSEENRIEVEVEVWDTHGRRNLSLNRMRDLCRMHMLSSETQYIYGSMCFQQWGRRFRPCWNPTPTAKKKPSTNPCYTSQKTLPGDGELPMGSSSIPNTFSMMIPWPILLHQLNPTLKRRFASFYFSIFKGFFIGL